MGFGDAFFDRLDRKLGNTQRQPNEFEMLEKKDFALRADRAQKRKELEDARIKEVSEKRRVLTEKKEIFTDESLDLLYIQAQKTLGIEQFNKEEFLKTFLPLYENEKAILDEEIATVGRVDFDEKNNSHEAVRAKKMATILEAALADCVAKYQWFGQHASIHTPNKVDEVRRGIDSVLEFKKEGTDAYLGIGIDVTFGKLSGPAFTKKINNILNGIDRGRLAEMRYFQFDDETPAGKMSLPKIVFSADYIQVEELAYSWSKRKEDPFKQKLKDHNIKYEVVGQIINQCELFAEYADRQGFGDTVGKAYRDYAKNIIGLAENQESDFKKLLMGTESRQAQLEAQRIKQIMGEHKQLSHAA